MACGARRGRSSADTQDGRHDGKSRGSWYYLTARAELTQDPEEAQARLELRDLLLPQGLSVTLLGYQEEAGNAALVASRLTAKIRAEPKKLRVTDKRTLLDEVDAWLGAGAALGKLENERVQLQGRRDDAEAPKGGAARARNAWVKMANALIANLEISGAPEETVRRLVGPLREAEAKADRRATARRSGEAPAEPTPAPGDKPQTP